MLDILGNAQLDSGRDVNLTDAIVDARLEVLLARATTTVQNKRHSITLVKLHEACNIEARGSDILTVLIADSDSQSINTRTGDKLGRLLDIGEEVDLIVIDTYIANGRKTVLPAILSGKQAGTFFPGSAL